MKRIGPSQVRATGGIELTFSDKAREVFQTALEFFGDEEEQVEKAQAVFGAFARMETRLKEFDRARVIYKFALARLPRSKSANCR